MGTNVSEEPVASIFSVEVPFLPEVGGSTFFLNVTIIYQTTWRHSPEDNHVHHRPIPKIQNPLLFLATLHK
jgi:hypothetical protein